MRSLFMLALVLAVVGCSSVSRRTDFGGVTFEGGQTPVEAVDIFNTNWLFLSLLPIASGDPDNPDGWTTCFFQDTATPATQLKMLEDEAKRVGAKKAINVSTISTDEEAFLFLFLREKYHTTAVLIK